MKKKYDICSLKFFIFDRKTLKECLKKMPIRTIVVYCFMPIAAILYYVTLPFAIINDLLGGI